MSSQFDETGDTCAVCENRETDRGELLRVYHGEGFSWCGRWIHQYCRGENAEQCPCGNGTLDDGVENAGYFVPPVSPLHLDEAEDDDEEEPGESTASLGAYVLSQLDGDPSPYVNYRQRMGAAQDEHGHVHEVDAPHQSNHNAGHAEAGAELGAIGLKPNVYPTYEGGDRGDRYYDVLQKYDTSARIAYEEQPEEDTEEESDLDD